MFYFNVNPNIFIKQNKYDLDFYKNKIILQNINYNLNKILIKNYKIDSNSFFFKKKHYFNINSIFFNFNKNVFFSNFFYNYCYNKKNFIILDTDFSLNFPLYRQMYGLKFLNVYKNFFFINPKNFILKNWLFFFIKFCHFNNINLLFIFDYAHYANFYKNISYSDLSVSAIVPYSYIDDYVDYPLYSYSFDIFIKTLYSAYIFQIYSLSINNLLMLKQYLYIYYFLKFCKKI